MNRLLIATPLAALLSVALLASPASANWVETFNSGFDQTWSFFDNAGNPLPDANTAITTTGGALTIKANVTANFDLSAAGLVAQSFTDVRVVGDVSQVISAAGPLGNNDAFIGLRSNGVEAYLLSLDFLDGDVDIVRINNVGAIVPIGLGINNPAWFSQSATYKLAFTAIGSSLTGEVYDSMGSLLDTLSVSDGTLTSGFSAVGAALNGDNNGAGSTILATRFDNVSSTAVPEPATLLLALMAFAPAVTRRRRAA